MDAATLQILKTCAFAFVGTFLLCGLGLLVRRSVLYGDRHAAGAGLPLILCFTQFGVLAYSLSLLGQAGPRGFHLSSVLLVLAAYGSAIALAPLAFSTHRRRKSEPTPPGKVPQAPRRK